MQDSVPTPQNEKKPPVKLLIILTTTASILLVLVSSAHKNYPQYLNNLNKKPQETTVNYLSEQWEPGETFPLYDHRFQTSFKIPSSWKASETGDNFREYKFKVDSQEFALKVFYDNFHFTLKDPEKLTTQKGYQTLIKKDSSAWIAEISHPEYQEVIVKIQVVPAPRPTMDHKLDPIFRKIIDSTEFMFLKANFNQETEGWQPFSLPLLGLKIKLPYPEYHDTEYYDSTYNPKLKAYTIDAWNDPNDALFIKVCKKLKLSLSKNEYAVICKPEDFATTLPWLKIEFSKFNKDSNTQTLADAIDLNNTENIGFWEGEMRGRNYVYLSTNVADNVGNIRHLYTEVGNTIIKMTYSCSFHVNPLCSEFIFPLVWNIEKL